jgi:hypothetical protein
MSTNELSECSEDGHAIQYLNSVYVREMQGLRSHSGSRLHTGQNLENQDHKLSSEPWFEEVSSRNYTTGGSTL